MQLNKNLFIPLKGEYFDAFEAGTKPSELRVYGKRWNEKTCYAGRGVILSRGYGKKHRLRGVITGIEIAAAHKLPEKHRFALLNCYGRLDMKIIIIHIEILKGVL